jgi:two-component system chemotaxis response regulator CheY
MTARILVVDDAATVRMYHRKMLGGAGWATEEAANGMEALEKIAAQPPGDGFDLLVVDVNMPKMDGYSLVRELRRTQGLRQVPVLMVSTEAQPQDVSAGQDAGANAYLVKPARPADLVLSAALLLGDGAAAMRAAHQIEGSRRAAPATELQGQDALLGGGAA